MTNSRTQFYIEFHSSCLEGNHVIYIFSLLSAVLETLGLNGDNPDSNPAVYTELIFPR